MEGSLPQAVALAFSSQGALVRSDPSLAQREVQQRLAESVALAIEQRGALVAEAGTGVGKTFAYLVPLLLSGRRALVSTATKSLQDQLFLRDLPRLCDALGVPVTAFFRRFEESRNAVFVKAGEGVDRDALARPRRGPIVR